eukprot:7079090-Ditylum_brightwellii.AAC.1
MCSAYDLMAWALNKYTVQKTRKRSSGRPTNTNFQRLGQCLGQRTDYNDQWQCIPPESGSPLTKVMDDKPWNWCPNHRMWCHHRLQ